MKNFGPTPRTLADASFVSGYRIARLERRAEAALGFVVAIVIGILAAALLIHWAMPCEAGALCSALMPAGCDQQGRHETRPHGPAEAATEIGADDDRMPGDGSLAWVGMSLILASLLGWILFTLYLITN